MASNMAGIAAGLTSAFTKTEHPFLTLQALAEAARQDSPSMSLSRYRLMLEAGNARLARISDQQTMPLWQRGERRALPRGVAEIFGARLAEAAGLQAAPVRLSEREPDSFDGYVKRVPGGWACSESIKQAIPLFYLSDTCQTVPDSLAGEPLLHEHWKAALDKRCVVERASYSDFPEIPPAAALRSARWDSPARLLQYAYRLFAYFSHPHTSNSLVNLAGDLFLIDHEAIIYRPDNSDIGKLHGLVSNSSGVMAACQQVSSITPNSINLALADIPAPFWRGHSVLKKQPVSVFTHPKTAADYFIERLALWRSYFPAKG